MLRPGLFSVGFCGILTVVGAALGLEKPGIVHLQTPPLHKGHVIGAFLNEHPLSGLRYQGNQIERVYGRAFSTGATAEQSADNFRRNYTGMWGVPADDLKPVGPFEDGRHVQPIMYIPETGQYKFTGVYYTQMRGGIPVYGSRLVLLTRNEPNNPVVLASSSLRDLGDFQVEQAMAARREDVVQRAVRRAVAPNSTIAAPEFILWAGLDDVQAAPVLAQKFVTETSDPARGIYNAEMIVADAATGDILHREPLLHDINIVGNVSGRATPGNAADACTPDTIIMPMPYARVAIGATAVFADVNGNFIIPNAGLSNVQVDSAVRGQYFQIVNTSSPGGGNSTMSKTVSPPGPANFLYNDPDVAGNSGQYKRAEVNAYIQSNVVRDHALEYNPSFPSVSTETNFTVNVNINLTCNAFYSSLNNTLNFYVAGGGCTNTANSTVVHHEFGHRLVQAAGSGQGAYGEGMGDVMAVLIADDPCLGDGFQNCGVCLRTAANTCQYQTSGCSSCGSEIHDCGRLFSGCVWSVRNNLLATNPATYREILSSIAINSMLVHTGSSITPSITVDFLTLDDDDADINNGTPHYNEINGGFAAHNMPGPALPLLAFSYPNGRPSFVNPAGGTAMRVNVNPLTGSPQPGTAKLFVNTGGGFVQATMNQISPNVYDAVFPAANCGAEMKYYVSAQATNNIAVTSPVNAPAGFFTAASAVSATQTHAENFQSGVGWAVANSGGLTGGAWERGTPITNCNRGNPTVDGDGSGMCYLTQNTNNPPANDCNSDVDGGTTTLTSPIMDASQTPVILTYSRWFTNLIPDSVQDDTFIVEFSVNGGSSWLNLETVGPFSNSANPVQQNTWVTKSFNLGTVAGFVPTSQFRLRFIAQDLGSGSVVEAGIDGVKLDRLNCINLCTSDVTGDSEVDVSDMLAVINAWGPCAGCAADIDDDGMVDVNDLLVIVNAWGSCP